MVAYTKPNKERNTWPEVKLSVISQGPASSNSSNL